MRVALVNPAPSGMDRDGDLLVRLQKPEIQRVIRLVEDDAECVPPLSLLAVAAELPATWELQLIDEPQMHNGERDWTVEPWDLVMVTAMINQVKRAQALGSLFRSRGIRTVVGGFHATACPEEMQEYFDHVICGEGETPLQEFLADLQRGRPRPCYINRGIADLSKLNPPRYELISQPDRYTMFPVLATRGCPHDCSFCSVTTMYGHQLRARPVADVLRDITAIKMLVRRPFISFTDENLLASRPYARELLAALVGMRIRFECHTDITVAEEPELLAMLVQAGCSRLQIGFETTNLESLEQIGPFKSRVSANLATSLQTIQQTGIRVMGMFLVGLDGDSLESLGELEEFVMASGFHQVDFSILTPVPGTAIFQQLEEEKRILTHDWDRYSWQDVVYQPKQLSGRQLKKWINCVLARFYAPEAQMARRKYFKELLWNRGVERD